MIIGWTWLVLAVLTAGVAVVWFLPRRPDPRHPDRLDWKALLADMEEAEKRRTGDW